MAAAVLGYMGDHFDSKIKEAVVFVDDLVAGNVTEGDIDEYVNRCHALVLNNNSLCESLGMTREGYEAWVGNPDALSEIVAARKNA